MTLKKYSFLFLLILFINLSSVNADLKDYSSGSSGSVGNLSGTGNWTATYSGIKIGIINSDNELEDVEIILDNSLPKNMYFSYNNEPKMFQPSNITWEYKATKNYLSTSLVPDSWYDSNSNFINLDKWLSDNNYSRLKSILKLKKNNKKLFPTLSSGDYITIEPMTYIDGYFGTAYELGNAFLTLSNSCKKEGNFCWNYSAAVFGGTNSTKNTSRRCGGMFHRIIYLSESIPVLGLTEFKDSSGCNATKSSIFTDRHNCLKSSTCGRGIGVYKYNDLFNGSIEITKYKTGATTPISNAGFTLYSDSSCKKELISEKTTNSKGKLTFKNLNTGTYYYKETRVPTDYTGNTSCKSVKVTNGSKSKVTVYNTEVLKNGDLQINIKIKGTDTLITSSNATFKIYEGKNCSGTAIKEVLTSMGQANINLDPGTYSVKEITQPDGYVASIPKCVKTNISISAGKKTTENVFYEANCNTKLKNLGNNPSIQQLFNLYKEFPNNKNLLNLSNPSCSVGSCSDNSLSVNCLAASTISSTFNETNLSCYNGDPLTDDYGNYIGFCQTTYTLTNNLGVNKFYAKSGRLLINQKGNILTIFKKDDLGNLVEENITNEFIAGATTSKTCYLLNEINVSNISVLPQYNVYFGDNNNDNIADSLPNVQNQNIMPRIITGNGLNKYMIIKTNNYSLNALYLEKLTGKYSNAKSESTISEPIYGLLSRFDIKTGTIPFKVNNVSSNSCTFETTKEIIDEKQELEFRIIDTNTPFNRDTMTNWSDGDDNSKDNNKVKTYIKDAVNSYGLDKNGNKMTPKYKITLTPSDILSIREYNKTNKYDNYLTIEVEYNNNKIIRNSFLYSLETGKLNNKNLNNKLYNLKYPI